MIDKIGWNTFGNYIWQGTWLTLPLYPWFDDKTKQVYTRNIFKVMQEFEVTFVELKEMLDSYVKWRNDTFGRHCNNDEYYLMRENKRFAFTVAINPQDNVFCLWDDFSQSLGSCKVDIKKPPSDGFIYWIENITKEYCDGDIHCSSCGQQIKQKEIAGRYFAGIYCKDCWESKYKDIEAKETYE